MLSDENIASVIKLKSDSEVFLSFHYPELKDLGKHFLVIISAVLAFSVTFSEKIIGISGAGGLQMVLLLSSWGLLIVALVATGIGIYFNFIAGAQANGAIIKGRPSDFKPLARRTYRLYQVAGGAFIMSLILLVVDGSLKVLPTGVGQPEIHSGTGGGATNCRANGSQ